MPVSFITLLSSWFMVVTFHKPSSQWETTQNQPPNVSIVFPKDKTTVQPGQQISYSIEVADAEDGESKYREIVGSEVFMEIRYFTNRPDDMKMNPVSQNKALQIMTEHGCFNCHQWDTELVGPSMVSIADKYDNSLENKLITSIIKGSVEIWGSEPMPPQPQLSPQEARVVVQWILANGVDKSRVIYPGLSGYFTVDPRFQSGFYMLTASYMDKGLGEEMTNRLAGYDQVVLTIDD